MGAFAFIPWVSALSTALTVRQVSQTDSNKPSLNLRCECATDEVNSRLEMKTECDGYAPNALMQAIAVFTTCHRDQRKVNLDPPSIV